MPSAKLNFSPVRSAFDSIRSGSVWLVRLIHRRFLSEDYLIVNIVKYKAVMFIDSSNINKQNCNKLSITYRDKIIIAWKIYALITAIN